MRWFATVSWLKTYSLDQTQMYNLQLYIWDLYRRVILSLIKRKRRELAGVLKSERGEGLYQEMTHLLLDKDILK